MSDRYIADRFLPDKAIDLIDEAAAKLKMEITSKPLHLDEIDRKVSTLFCQACCQVHLYKFGCYNSMSMLSVMDVS